MNSMKAEANADPDYENIQEECISEVNESLQREDARDHAIHKMQNIIHEQFSFEINLKEKEVSTLNHRVHECRTSLDRLRACVLAGYYGYGTTPASVRQAGVRSGKTRTSFKETNVHDIMNWKHSLPSNLNEQEPDKNLSSPNQANESITKVNNANTSQSKIAEVDLPNLLGSDKPNLLTGNESRFYIKRKIIIGNTSKYILPDQRERNDRSTHKWMVYVRGPKDDGELQNFISKVWFLLHPSYQPNDLVEVCKPPFQVTRRGWGEFPVRVQLHFVENKNKRVDIIHHLKLDKTYTGLQTLGAETHVEIELDRKNFDGLNADTSRKNMAISSKDLLQNSCSERENTTPVSSKSFDVAPGQCEIAMDCESSKVDQKGSRRDRYGSEHGVLNDHSYSTVATAKPAYQDDMKCPTSLPIIPKCSSPTKDATLPESVSLESDFEHELLLQKCVEVFPVVRAEKCSNTPGYCASSLEQFLGWNLGKRLAAEWQRALAMKAHIEKERALKLRIERESKALELKANIQKESHTLSMKAHFHQESLSLSTKDVMNYCRMHGYTPVLPSSTKGNILCKFCGEEMNETDLDENDQPMLAHEECVSEFEEDDVSGTYVTAEKFLETLSKSECISRKHDKSPDDDGIVDVVGVADAGLTKDPSKPRLFFLPVTAEHEWIQEIASEVDVSLTNFDIDGVHAPVTSAMLYKACTMFVEDIVRKANRFTWKSTLRIPKAKCILPYHVKQALEVIPHCDFLTNKYLKVDTDTDTDTED